ncbi:SURF1 family protein [Sphingomonas floccifaciens]|uniref:SURF1-like protein n=1 Tax=Sphingomonas floccifaciens TaxID=1844115 RepID=A0ABW4NFR1_9SPHN
MKRWPVIPTLVVAIAIVAMIGLGFWQLARRQEKEAALVQLAANVDRPPVLFPAGGTGDDLLFRKSAIDCLSVTDIARQSGRTAGGTPGWRVIAACRTPTAGIVAVQLGIASDFNTAPAFSGGPVTGYLSYAPDSQPLITDLFNRSPKRLMLISDAPPIGLTANPGPDLSSVPNNHLAYAVQWFLFAGVAAIIYLLALRRRRP